MGWCSGTPIFDAVAKFVIESSQPEQAKVDVLKTLAEAMENEDWDCQDDSDYRDHPIVKRVLHELHPDWDWLP
jgi:hypothetical protein